MNIKTYLHAPRQVDYSGDMFAGDTDNFTLTGRWKIVVDGDRTRLFLECEYEHYEIISTPVKVFGIYVYFKREVKYGKKTVDWFSEDNFKTVYTNECSSS